MIFALILALVIAILMVFFALENPVMVTVSFFGYSIEGSLALFILAAMGIGMLVGLLLMTPSLIRSGLSNARHRKRIGTLEASLEEHRTRLSTLEKPEESTSPPEFESTDEK